MNHMTFNRFAVIHMKLLVKLNAVVPVNTDWVTVPRNMRLRNNFLRRWWRRWPIKAWLCHARSVLIEVLLFYVVVAVGVVVEVLQLLPAVDNIRSVQPLERRHRHTHLVR